MNIKNIKIAVIGGGAAGLACAISCGRRFGKNQTLIIEKQARTGRKLLATGNGRCNITNRNVNSSHYYGDKKIIESVLKNFGAEDSENFFEKMGLLFRDEDDGRVYPYSNQASSVLDCMLMQCEKLGIEIMCNFNIKSLKRENSNFIIVSDEFTVIAEYIVFATGTKASPSLGADDSGYDILKNLGIKSTNRFAALSPIYTKEKYKSLKGVRAKGSVKLLTDKKIFLSKNGEIQFTDYGVSGICVFEISRFVNEFLEFGKISEKKYSNISISIDVMNDYDFYDLCLYLQKCRKIFSDRNSSDILSGALNQKLSQAIIEYCKLSYKKCSELSDGEIKKIAFAVKNFEFTPINSNSYKNSQVSAGGINSEFVNSETLMSKKIKNLFICGELLDVDGDCGGYNLHFAFGSGITVSKHI